uniref:Reverse transcriptase domain-containing protein n=1 Tax=Tanacetum cinerariifolium TaxID=118510 RepID=A0A699HSF6_TANCI|nr:reverse transcriptase domain-containing protein [Tanacetum cinerariifolium]
MADNRTMKEMLQAPTEGYGDAIVVPAILAENFVIVTGLLSLIQANQFQGFESNNPHDHIRSFNMIAWTLKFRDVPNDAIKLMLFPYSLEGADKIYTDARIDKLTDTISTLVETFNKKMTTPATVKAVEETCVICGGAHPYYDCIATDSNISSVCATTDALLLMPKFASTIKSLFTNKDKLFELAKIPLNENCSSMLLKKLPEKLGDPGRSFLRTGRALIDVYGEEIILRVNDEAVTFNLNQTTRYSSTYDDLSVNRIDNIDVASEEYAQEILGFSSNSLDGNPTSTFKPILSNSSPSLTPFEGSDFILEEIDAYLIDESISSEIDHADCDPEGDICLIENLLNDDPF